MPPGFKYWTGYTLCEHLLDLESQRFNRVTNSTRSRSTTKKRPCSRRIRGTDSRNSLHCGHAFRMGMKNPLPRGNFTTVLSYLRRFSKTAGHLKTIATRRRRSSTRVWPERRQRIHFYDDPDTVAAILTRCLSCRCCPSLPTRWQNWRPIAGRRAKAFELKGAFCPRGPVAASRASASGGNAVLYSAAVLRGRRHRRASICQIQRSLGAVRPRPSGDRSRTASSPRPMQPMPMRRQAHRRLATVCRGYERRSSTTS